MADIDDIIERLLGDRRIREGAAFSSRSYNDQPLIERGSSLKERMERRAAERAARHQEEARTRQDHARELRRSAGNARAAERASTAPSAPNKGTDAWRPSLGADGKSLFSSLFDMANAEPLPQPIREMRKLEGAGVPSTLAYSSNAMSSLFYRQALLMEDYEDDYEFHGDFSQYYPTYAAMSNQQLRGYFSWRTRVRRGQVDPAPLSFAFVHVYELLCGIGTRPGAEGLHALQAFGEAFRQADEYQGMQLAKYLRRWMADYAVYHNVEEALPSSANELSMAVLTLLKAEHAHLRETGRSPRIANDAALGQAPTTSEVFGALGMVSTYHICESRLAKDEPELLAAVATDVFFALVDHCSKRRKTDLVEGLFGYASRMPHTMFQAAVFYDPNPHEDCRVQLSECEYYTCTGGRWYHWLLCTARSRNSDLGLALHAADYELRHSLDYAYPLKQRQVPRYVQKMVQDAVAARLKQRAEAERRRITIDRSKLGGIRAAAAVTQEALLTDEERGIEDAHVTGAPEAGTVPWPPAADGAASDTPAGKDARSSGAAAADFSTNPSGLDMPLACQADSPRQAPRPRSSPPARVSEAAPSAAGGHGTVSATTPRDHAGATRQASTPSPSSLLSAVEARLVRGLLDGTPAAELLGPADPFVSVVVDSINEKLFDVVGDAVIEFGGDEPRIIEDYLDDIREVLDT